MRQLFFVLVSCLFAFGIPIPGNAQETRMSPELLWKLGRLGNPTALNNDWAAYTVRRYEIAENSGTSTLYLHSLTNGEAKPLLSDWKSIGDVQVASFGEKEPVIYFLGIPPKKETNEDDKKDAEPADDAEGNFDSSPQLYGCDLSGKFQRISGIEDGIANLKVSPTGKHVAFTRDIKLDAEVTELYEDLPQADARIIDKLMYRHWNAWHDYKYSHLHVAALNDDGTLGTLHDLMEGMKVDCPVPPFGGSEQFAWAPTGDEICYTAKIVEDWAQSTDSDLYLVMLNADGSQKGEASCITEGQDGYDNNPFYSPDGKYLGYNSMKRPGFEADRNRVMVFDRKTKATRDLTAGLDQNANHPHWTNDSQGVVFMSEYRGSNQLFTMGLADSKPTQITTGDFNWDIVAELNKQRMLVTKTSMLRPAELYLLNTQDKSDTQVTTINNAIYKNLALPTVKERWVEATDGKKIQCWVIYPPGFDENKKYPLLTYCQGGPQGQIGQWFSYRWNFNLMASHGDYVIIAPNRRGLPGFGREWNDQISGDWGGQAMQDLLSATDAMLKEPYIDKDRVGAIGASFGGYTVYWMMGNHEDRFATMIAHCGVFNLESMYGSTEELFFVNWDLGGPYWKSPDVQDKYTQFSPHRFVKNWETPLLVIHGEKDFRVPITQGMEAFTAAQTQGVDSRFLYFPEEGHWVMSPQNGVLWHRVFFDWLGRELK